MIRHRSAGCFDHAFGIDAVAFAYGGLQRRVAVTVVSVNLELGQINRQFTQWKWANTAGRKVEPAATLRLGPVHVFGMLVSHECARRDRFQYQYTGIPASMMPSAIALLRGV